MSLGEFLGSGSAVTKGLYHLNGNSTDFSGNNNNGTATNVTWVGGILGSGAGSFNGTTSYIDIASSALNTLLCGTNPFTTSFICNTTQSSLCAIIDTRITDQNGFFIQMNSGLIQAYRSDGVNAEGTTGITINDGKNKLITITYTGTILSIYINGVFGNSVSSSRTLNSSTTVNIGSVYNSNVRQYYFNGIIDEVIIENRAWTAEEIRRYYTYSRGMFGI